MRRRDDQIQYDRTVTGDYPVDLYMFTGPLKINDDGDVIVSRESFTHVTKAIDLKYARNPGSTAVLYRDEDVNGPCITNARITKAKKDPGYINIEDGNRAIRTARKIHDAFPDNVSCCIVKHETPCGAGRGDSVYEAFLNGWYGDDLSAFGSVIALSEIVGEETAKALKERTPIEWVIAPGYTDAAMDVLKKTSIRLMEVPSYNTPFDGPNLEIRDVEGGYLVGERYDSRIVSPEFIEVKFGSPTKEDFNAAILNWLIIGQGKSNCVGVGDAYRAHGIGAGQTSRVDATMLALYKASKRDWKKVFEPTEKWATSLVGASDAFWPFPDGPEFLAKAGVRGCIYPTGSNKDEESFEMFDKHGMFVMITRPVPGDPNTIERAFY